MIKFRKSAWLILLMIVMAVPLVLAGCGSQSQGEDQASAETAASEETAEATEDADADDPESAPGPEGWTIVGSAEEAAEGAGLDSFIVMDDYTIGDMEFEDPAFSYLDGVAQAYYEEGAAAFYIRKGAEKFSAPISDRDYKGEFTKTWTQNFKGLEVKCYGFEQDKAIVVAWTAEDGTYAFTSQGLGGEEVTMSPDDISSILAGIQ